MAAIEKVMKEEGLLERYPQVDDCAVPVPSHYTG